MAQRRGENLVWIPWIRDDPPALPRILQPDMRPRLPAVRGLVHSIPIRNRGAHVRLARARINYIRIRRRHRDRPSRRNRLRIKDGIPRSPRVIGLPNAPAHASEVETLRTPADAAH